MENSNVPGFLPAPKEVLLTGIENVMKAIVQAHHIEAHPDPNIGGSTIDNDLRLSMQWNHHLAMNCPQPMKADIWYLQSDMFFVKFRRTNNRDDLEEAVTLAERAIEELLPDDVERLSGKISCLLARLLRFRYGWTKSPDDLRKGRTYGQQAYDATKCDAPERIIVVDLLAALLYELYIVTGDSNVLQKSISLTQETVTISQEGGFRWCIATNLLANRLHDQYDLTQAVSFLNESMRQAILLLKHTPANDPELWVRRNNLASKFLARYTRGKDPADLDLAINTNKQAMEACTSELQINKVNLGLASLLHNRYDLSGNMDDLELAIDLTEKGIGQLPDMDPHRHGYEFNLANMYWAKYEFHNDLNKTRVPDNLLDDIPGLVEFIEMGVEERLQKANIDDLDKSIKFYRKALDDLPEDHMNEARFAFYTGRAIENRYCRSALLRDSEDAVSFYERAWRANGSRLLERIQGAREAAKMYTYGYPKDLTKSSEWLRSAVEMLPMISPRSIDDEDRQHTLGNFAGLASMAAAVALEAGHEPCEALELLEIGRGVMANLTLQLRTDTSDLKQQHPQLADEFEELREELSVPSAGNPAAAPLLAEGKRRSDAEQRFRTLVKAIREKDNFEYFLLPPPVHELKNAVEGGSMVILNVCQLRCDAFLIDSSGLRVLKLPDLTLQDAEEHAKNLTKSSSACSTHLLQWLWDVAAGPILKELGFQTSPSSEKWPRIWWVLTGPLVHLPFHAAGYHDDASGNTVLDRVMSSYCTSASFFAHERRKKFGGDVKAGTGQALLVAMKKTRGMDDLSFATEEVDKVSQICNSMGLAVVRPEPSTRSSILDSLRSCSIFHFAGHGQTNSEDPSQSSLHLEDMALTVGDLRNSHLPQQSLFLAYLSACSTGANRADGLLDEGIHLISGCQLAGFRHVIGTLWQVSDQYCVPVASEIYEMLLNEKMGDENVCKSLHRSLRALRSSVINRNEGDNKADSVAASGRYAVCKDHGAPAGRPKEAAYMFHWVPYVHFGP